LKGRSANTLEKILKKKVPQGNNEDPPRGARTLTVRVSQKRVAFGGGD